MRSVQVNQDAGQVSMQGVQVQGPRNTQRTLFHRRYQRVSDQQREQLIHSIEEGMSIAAAARLTNINYENAKSIFRVYRLQHRRNKMRGN